MGCYVSATVVHPIPTMRMDPIKPRTNAKDPVKARSKAIHTALPVDEIPFSGLPVEYTFLKIPIRLKYEVSENFFNHKSGETVASSNIASKYSKLTEQYNEHFRLSTFYQIPGAKRLTSALDQVVTEQWQGVFWKSPEGASHKQWELRPDKALMQVSSIVTGLIGNVPMVRGTQTNTSDIMDKIALATATGDRLVCLCLTGEEVQGPRTPHAMGYVSPLKAVDLYFDVPLLPNPVLYTYQVVTSPITIVWSHRGPGATSISCDWQAVLTFYLNQGWRLIDVFFDESHTQVGRRWRPVGVSENVLWFFEKEKMQLDNPTPSYEGFVVKYNMQYKEIGGGMVPKSDWTTVIKEMGTLGWEFACFLETPLYVMVDLGEYAKQMLLIFQRPILAASGEKDGVPSTPPPPYSTPPPPYEDTLYQDG